MLFKFAYNKFIIVLNKIYILSNLFIYHKSNTFLLNGITYSFFFLFIEKEYNSVTNWQVVFNYNFFNLILNYYFFIHRPFLNNL